MGRLLAYDKLAVDAAENFRKLIVETIDAERERLAAGQGFQEVVRDAAEIDVGVVSFAYGEEATAEQSKPRI